MAAGTKQLTLIYAGEDTWDLSVQQVERMLAERIDHMGYRFLTSRLLKKIRDYVQNGGKFLGICAGAIIATERQPAKPLHLSPEVNSSELISLHQKGKLYQKSDEGFEKKLICLFPLYPGICLAPHVVVTLKADEMTNFCTVNASFSPSEESFHSAHYSGPVFPAPLPPETNVLLRYSDQLSMREVDFVIDQTAMMRQFSETGITIEEEHPAAVLSYPSGRGKIVLSGVHPEQIGLIGHSEGGLIAPMVAAKSRDVAFIVLMAGGGITGEATLYAQEALISRSMGVSEEQLSHQLDFQKQLLSVIINEPDLEKAEKLLREMIAKQLVDLPQKEQQRTAELMDSQMKRFNSRWFRYFLTYDPITSLKHLKIPVLAMNGELDSQVLPKHNLPVIAKILEQAGNRSYKIIEFPKLNHLFQTCESGSILEYGNIEETIAPVVLETISNWILQNTTNLQKSSPYQH